MRSEPDPSLKFSVCIPTVRPATLGHTIDSVFTQSRSDWELIIVGQGSAEGLREAGARAAARDPRVRYVHLDTMGVSLARNAGLRSARADIVAFIDDDCEARSDWLEEIGKAFDADSTIGLVGGAMIPPARPGPFAYCSVCDPEDTVYDPAVTPRNAPRGWDFASGNMAIRREVAEKIGPFDEQLGPGGAFPWAEDADYKLRLESAGVRMRATPKAYVNHTYGWRRGLKALTRMSRNNARGMGGLAAKLTMLGDGRGKEWMKGERDRSLVAPLRSVKPHRVAVGLWRMTHFMAAYRECLANFEIDPRGDVLRPRAARASASLSTA